jgi:hemerythrin-like domain-containing protein
MEYPHENNFFRKWWKLRRLSYHERVIRRFGMASRKGNIMGKRGRFIWCVIALCTVGTMLMALRDSEGQSRATGGIVHPEVAPVEDLMREHGVLRRALLIYEEAVRRIEAGKATPAEDINRTAMLISDFIENYHEKNEEQYLFPLFERAGKELDLVRTLLHQHDVGRSITAGIITLTHNGRGNDESDRLALVSSMRAFIRMYRPHAAREDTELFPRLHELLSEGEWNALGDQFEEKEKLLPGGEGFEGAVKQIAEIEKSLGIFNLSQFTPKQ